MNKTRLYIGTFLLALSTLVLEISLARLLSVSSYYYLAFFTISTAMLGSTAGAMFVFLRPLKDDPDAFTGRLTTFSTWYAVILPLSLIILCVLPMDFYLSRGMIVMNLVTLFLATLASSAPFYFSGVVITSVLTRQDIPVGRVYASDLIGASFGCLFVLAALWWFSVPTLILLCGLLALAAGISYSGAAWRTGMRFAPVLAIILCVLMILNETEPFGVRGIRPYIVKGKFEAGARPLFERWNSFSRVTVNHLHRHSPQYWGASRRAPFGDSTYQHSMMIDGMAGTTVRRFQSLDDIDHLRYDLTNIAYYLRPTGGACIIGVGGGRDIQSALLFGHKRIVGVELNPIFTELHATLFRNFSGIYGRKGVTLADDEGRSYLSRSHERFSILQLSLIDTWASTGAGAFSLSENSLYTVEGWRIFFHHLKDDGILTVSRWHNPDDLGETGRILSLAKATLLAEGVANSDRHICLLTCDYLSTLLLKKTPFTEDELHCLRDVVTFLEFRPEVFPGDTVRNYWLGRIRTASTLDELSSMGRNQTLDFSPPTDDNPFFFNMLRFSRIPSAFFSQTIEQSRGVITGNLLATLVLIMLIFSLACAAGIAIILPVLTARVHRSPFRSKKLFLAGAMYFSLIGSGFMLLEISLMQRCTMFLGHPIYSLSIILFSLIASTGAGSYLSDRIRLDQNRFIGMLPVAMSVYVLLLLWLLPHVFSGFIASGLVIRAGLTCLVTIPLGLLLGCFFPLGMRFVRASDLPQHVTPWYWGLNGIFGVLSSAIAILISIYSGISTNYYIAIVFYLLLIPCIRIMNQRPRVAKDLSSGAGR